MSALTAALQGRASAERIMLDTCVIRRKTGTVFNETTGQYADTTSTIYTGGCRVKPPSRLLDESEAGGREVVHAYAELQMPVVASAAVVVDDVAEITVSADPQLVGRRFRVVNLDYGSQTTARRLQVEDVTG